MCSHNTLLNICNIDTSLINFILPTFLYLSSVHSVNSEWLISPSPLPAFGPGAVTLPNGPPDMRSAVMITLRDFSSVCLNDRGPWGQINNQPAAVSPATVLIWNFLRRFGRTLPAQGHYSLHLWFLAATNRLDRQQFPWMVLIFIFLSIKRLKNPAKRCIEERKIHKNKTKQSSAVQTCNTIPASGRFLSHAAIFLF